MKTPGEEGSPFPGDVPVLRSPDEVYASVLNGVRCKPDIEPDELDFIHVATRDVLLSQNHPEQLEFPTEKELVAQLRRRPDKTGPQQPSLAVIQLTAARLERDVGDRGDRSPLVRALGHTARIISPHRRDTYGRERQELIAEARALVQTLYGETRGRARDLAPFLWALTIGDLSQQTRVQKLDAYAMPWEALRSRFYESCKRSGPVVAQTRFLLSFHRNLELASPNLTVAAARYGRKAARRDALRPL